MLLVICGLKNEMVSGGEFISICKVRKEDIRWRSGSTNRIVIGHRRGFSDGAKQKSPQVGGFFISKNNTNTKATRLTVCGIIAIIVVCVVVFGDHFAHLGNVVRIAIAKDCLRNRCYFLIIAPACHNVGGLIVGQAA